MAPLITVQVPWDPKFLNAIANVPRRWNAELKAWHFPPDVAKKLVDEHLLPQLHHNLLQQAVDSWEEAMSVVGADVDLGAGPLAPSIPLYQHQEDAIRLLMTGSALLWHDMGLGKTRTALIASRMLHKRLVIVSPAIAKYVWAQEERLIYPGAIAREIAILDGVTLKTQKAAKEWNRVVTGCQIVIVNYDILYAWGSALLPYMQDAILCLDESHKVRTPSNRWTKALRPLALVADRTWCLTGTAMVNSALDVYYQLGLFGVRSPFAGVRARDFGQRYCQRKWNPFKGKGDWEFYGVKDEESLLRVAGVTLQRRRKAECLDLPQKLRLAVYVAELADSGAASLDDHHGAAALATLRRRLSTQKAQLTVDYIKEHPFDSPIVVFGWHRDYLDRVARQLSAPVIDGSTSSAKRAELIAEFQAGKIPILVGQIEAMGMAITLTRAKHAIFGEVHWSAVSMRQAEDRLHRIGQAQDVTYHYLLVARSVDQVVWDKALQKGTAIDRLDQAAVDLDELIKELEHVA